MRSVTTFRITLLSVLVTLLVAAGVLAAHRLDRSTYALEVALSASHAQIAQVYYDLGHGFRETDSTRLVIDGGPPVTYRFPLPHGSIKRLRLDPRITHGTALIAHARVIDRLSGRTIKTFVPADIVAEQQIASLETLPGDIVRMTSTPDGDDCAVRFDLAAPLELHIDYANLVGMLAGACIPAFVLAWLVFWVAARALMQRQEQFTQSMSRMRGWVLDHPQATICIAGALAAILSCYPVVFLGRSFVSPGNGPMVLLYEWWPTLPGRDISTAGTEETAGADVGAAMWQNVPFTAVEHTALVRDHELPLWNRYNFAGTPLLGQGISMAGDPLNLIPVLADGAYWAWDIKFVLAKMLFAAGVGMAAFAATRHHATSAALAASSAFIGFFAYRFSHPAFFTICYSPWLLYFWLRIAQATTFRATALHLAGAIAATWMILNSGTAKEAYLLPAGLGATGLLMVLLSGQRLRLIAGKLVLAAAAGVVFLLLAAPLWTTFLATMRASFYTYAQPSVKETIQYPPAMVLGLFDDFFFRRVSLDHQVVGPSLNFAILLGVLWAIARSRDLLRHRLFLAIALGALPSVALIFGVVSPWIIIRIPFLANVSHVHNVFSCILMMHLFVIAAFGFREFFARLNTPEWRSDFFTVALLLVAGLALIIGHSNLSRGRTIDTSFDGYLLAIVAAVLFQPWLVRTLAAATRPRPGLMALLVLCILALHWRHGMHVVTGFDEWVMNPQERFTLRAPSPAIDLIQRDKTEPSRAMGLATTLYPGFHSTYGIESIYGCDPLANRDYRALMYAAGIAPEPHTLMDWRFSIPAARANELHPLCDLLNIKYYLCTPNTAPEPWDHVTRVTQADLDVFQSQTVWPRAFFTDAVATYDTPERFVRMALENGTRGPFAAVQGLDARAVALTAAFPRDLADRTVTPATDYRLTANTTSFRIHAPRPGVVVLTEAYLANDFRVSVNGQHADYFRVNHAFKGIHLPAAGDYTITVAYWPRYLTGALIASGVGLACLIAWLALALRRPGAMSAATETLTIRIPQTTEA